MAEKKKAGVQVKPPEQREQVSETVQAPMAEATVAPESVSVSAPEMRNSLQARVDRLVDKPDGKLRAILSMNLPGGFAVHGIKIYENDGGLFVSMPQSSYTAADGTIKYRDIFHPVTANARQKLIGATVSAYHDALLQQEQTQAQTQKAAQSESPNAAPRDAPIMQM